MKILQKIGTPTNLVLVEDWWMTPIEHGRLMGQHEHFRGWLRHIF